MKKTVKVISTILLTLMLVTSVAGVVLAVEPNLSDTFENLNKADAAETGNLTNIGGKIINVIQVVGIIVAIVVILILGIKYMTGSVEQKAEYKKTMIPYVIGAILLVAGTTIVKTVYNIISANAGTTKQNI